MCGGIMDVEDEGTFGYYSIAAEDMFKVCATLVSPSIVTLVTLPAYVILHFYTYPHFHLLYQLWCPPEIIKSDPVQNVLASLASHVAIPRSSSGRPSLPKGLLFAHLSDNPGCVSR
jgi:hypothetical protein